MIPSFVKTEYQERFNPDHKDKEGTLNQKFEEMKEELDIPIFD